MCQALAALRVGFLSRQIRNSTPELDLAGMTALLNETDSALHGLSSRMNGYQRATVVEMWNRISRLQALARRLLPGDEDLALPSRMLKSHQERAWRGLRAMLAAIIGREPRLVAWFDIGDHLADISWQLYDGQLPLPLSDGQWDYIYSGADHLSKRERRVIGPFFPAGYNDRLHLACQLIATYRGLCGLLESVGDNITATPTWDGTTISYRGRQAVVKRQNNSIIIPILDECERLGWPESFALPAGLRGDVKQAVYHFNRLGVIRLSQAGDRVRW